MYKVCTNEVSGGKSAQKRQLTGHDRGGDNAGQALGVLTRSSLVRTPDAQHLEDRSLGTQNSTPTNSANLDGGHRYSHKKIFTVVSPK